MTTSCYYPEAMAAIIQKPLRQLAYDAKTASKSLARFSAAERTRAIAEIAHGLRKSAEIIAAANRHDLEAARRQNMSAAFCDRLTLSVDRIELLAKSVEAIAAQSDPVGEVTERWQRPNGLQINRVRVPLGVLLMIYEARPNVTIDAAALCLRSANAAILRGGSEAYYTNDALIRVVQHALDVTKLPRASIQMVPTQDREAIDALLQMDDFIDLVIPRGGEALIRRVASQSRIPVIKHYKGVCHVYVDAAADLSQALNIIENAKVQRPGVCNATETLLVDRQIAAEFLPQCAELLMRCNVELRGCEESRALVSSMKQATDEDWDTEYLDLILAVRVVDGLQGAIAHIDQHGTQHTAAIVTQDEERAQRFLNDVDASCVLVNASTRFNDGGELGLGAEMGISTTRVHAYGPMGARSLTTEKYTVLGNGQVRR